MFISMFDVQYWKSNNIWDKVFKNGPSKICGRQPLKITKGMYGLIKADHTTSKFWKAVHKFYLAHSWIPFPICNTWKVYEKLQVLPWFNIVDFCFS